MNIEFHVDDVFGNRFTVYDVVPLQAALAKKTAWTPEERRLVNLAIRDFELAQDIVVNNLEEAP